ncbi:M50 family metallopeptidase [Micromonospora sp. NBC_01699]|uniref:metalloprotease n=1 Tax=Micromonospora sp. NBC_01699 TaxID=2975984 RepID=UPI002E2B82E8|nr:M50 family metallopeptidase [Micromonospora sp. NBC_01699]
MTAGTLLSKRPRLHSEVRLSRRLLRGPAEIHLVKDLLSGRAFELAPREHFLVARLDGRRSLAEIGDEYAREFGRRLAEAHWQQLLGLLYARGLLDPGTADQSTADPGIDPSSAAAGRTPAGSGSVAPSDRASVPLIEWSYRRIRWALARPVVLSLLGLTVATQVVLLANLDRAVAGLGWFWEHPLWLIALGLLTWTSAALHELAHGVAARHFGCAVTAISVVTLRCRVDGYPYLRSPGAQITIAGAGGLANGVLMVPFALTWLVLAPTAPARPALAGIVLVGSAQSLVNLIPLPPLDGYKIVSHALGVTHLATGTRQFLWLAVRGLVGRGTGIGAYPSTARLRYAAYGLIALILAVTAGTATVLLGRAVAADRLGATAVVVTFAVVAMTVTGWLARPRRAPRAPDATERATPQKGRD